MCRLCNIEDDAGAGDNAVVAVDWGDDDGGIDDERVGVVAYSHLHRAAVVGVAAAVASPSLLLLMWLLLAGVMVLMET